MSYNKIGDVLVAQGNLPEALKTFRDGLAIRSVWRNPTPATPAGSATCRCPTKDRRRTGGAGQSARGAESYRDGLAIRERLAKSDPGNAGWQRDLSVSYNKIGDVLVAQGKLPEALRVPRRARD